MMRTMRILNFMGMLLVCLFQLLLMLFVAAIVIVMRDALAPGSARAHRANRRAFVSALQTDFVRSQDIFSC